MAISFMSWKNDAILGSIPGGVNAMGIKRKIVQPNSAYTDYQQWRLGPEGTTASINQDPQWRGQNATTTRRPLDDIGMCSITLDPPRFETQLGIVGGKVNKEYVLVQQ